jgi:hypothetical protein
MEKIILSLFILITSLSGIAQTEDSNMYQKTDLLIVYSTKNYKEAEKFAGQAAKKLSLDLDLRGHTPNKETGLTATKIACEESGYDYPFYLERIGDYDEGEYVSIEYSNGYSNSKGNLKKGYFLVVAASGSRDVTKPALKDIKKIYKDAYIQQVEMYLGCNH